MVLGGTDCKHRSFGLGRAEGLRERRVLVGRDL